MPTADSPNREQKRRRSVTCLPQQYAKLDIALSVLLEVGLLNDVVDFRLGEDVPHCGLLEQPANLTELIFGAEAQVEHQRKLWNSGLTAGRLGMAPSPAYSFTLFSRTI